MDYRQKRWYFLKSSPCCKKRGILMDVPQSNDSILISVRFSLAPIDNLLNSLSLLNETEHLIGLNAWVIRTARALTQQQKNKNRLIFELLRASLAPAPDISD